MTEKQTSQPESTLPDPFDEIDAMQKASEAARHITIEYPPVETTPIEVHETQSTSKPNKAGRILAGGAVALGTAAAATGLAGIAVNELAPPTFSEETTSVTVQPGDGLLDIAESVQGSENEDLREVVDRIISMPANSETLEDGLQPGEQIEIPVSVANYQPPLESNE